MSAETFFTVSDTGHNSQGTKGRGDQNQASFVPGAQGAARPICCATFNVIG